MKIKFLGGAGTVTGSKTLIESEGIRIMVDCGMFQGLKSLRELNWEPLPIPPSTIDCVLLTHGHLDHCGWLPILAAQGFNGKIFCTGPTKEVTRLVLLDSAKIQEEDAEKANKEHYSKHEIAKPLYTVEQAKKIFPLFRVVQPDEEIEISPGITVKFRKSGHIIGACSISLNTEGKTLLFSGDIGRDDDVLMYPPVRPKTADYIFLESTYGNRIHPSSNVKLELEMYISNTVHRGGTVIIPGFAVERVQSLMFLLWQLKKDGRLPDVPLVIDTPMGAGVLDIFKNNPSWHKLSLTDCDEMCRAFRIINDFEDTLSTIADSKPKVIIAASGMATGGRVLSYLEQYIGRPETTIIIVGFQAEGTRGRKLLEGAKEIKLHGRYFDVRANIHNIAGLSAHADQTGLLDWLSELAKPPAKVFIVHGENIPADDLRVKIRERYRFDCAVPLLGQEIEI